MSKTGLKFVVIGGGTGSFTVLSGLKYITDNIVALVNMSDDGGSTGVLRDELGVLPPGDIRQCLIALSQSPKLRDLFGYRFSEGKLSGHSFGNLFLSATEKMTDSFEEAVELASELLRVKGQVLPITTDRCNLVLNYQDGRTLKGEYVIGHMDFRHELRPTLSLDPQAYITTKGRKAILDADAVIIAPGNLYGSLAPTLLVKGVGEALRATKAKIIYVCNLVNKPGQTDDFKVHDFADEIERFIGSKLLDYVIFNTDEPPRTLLEKYTHEGENIVEFDLEHMAGQHYNAIGLPLVAGSEQGRKEGDKIAKKRSLIRHDTERLADEISRLAKGEK